MAPNTISGSSQYLSSVDYEIIKLKNVEKVGPNRYRSLSPDPQIYFSLKKSPSLPDKSIGHIFFHCLISSGSDYIHTELFLPPQRGIYSQANSIVRRCVPQNKSQTFLISSDYYDQILRLDPVNSQEEFEIRFMKFYLWSEQASLGFLCHDFANSLTDHRYSKESQQSSRSALLCPGSFDAAYANYLSEANKPSSYSSWIASFEASHLSKIVISKIHNQDLKFSVLLPVFNTEPAYLRACVESVLLQEYRNWELCIVDDCSSREDTIAELQLIRNLDSRIKVKFRSKNGHIVNTTNDALRMSTGEKICFLDHDDLLSPKALLYLAIEFQRNPDIKFIYTDEDHVDELGARTNPHFKSDWNRTLLYSHNYITHFVCCDFALVNAVNGLRLGTEGAQDYDFLLRITDLLKDEEILHIPHILYHWRMSNTSSAANKSAKPYTVEAGYKALLHHFSGKVNPPLINYGRDDNFYCLSWPTEHISPLVSIIIPTRDNLDCLKVCIESLEKSTYHNYEIVVVDNGSTDSRTLDYMQNIKTNNSRVKVVQYDIPFNFSRINNYAVQFCSGMVLCFLNDDTEVITNNWIEIMLGHALRKDVGCVGAKLLYSDNTIQHAGVITSIGGVAGHSHKHLPNHQHGYFNRPHIDQELSAVTGACLMVKKQIFESHNGFDEFLFAVAFNDVDFCLKVLSSGYKNVYASQANLYHHESKSRGLEDTPEKQRRFKKEVRNFQHAWKFYTMHDKYYSPHLSRTSEDFSLRA